MKKFIGLLLLGSMLILSSCETPKGPEGLEGIWTILKGEKWLVAFQDNTIGMTTFDQSKQLAFEFEATWDSLYITPIASNTDEMPAPRTCSYYFQNNLMLVINGLNLLYEDATTNPNQEAKKVVLVRLKDEIPGDMVEGSDL